MSHDDANFSHSGDTWVASVQRQKFPNHVVLVFRHNPQPRDRPNDLDALQESIVQTMCELEM